jgi:uncharacterized protein RhaS with RHS repeats
VDNAGAVVWQAAYMPFGEARVLTADVENNLRFPGQYFDAETGLHYNWHRYYDPETGFKEIAHLYKNAFPSLIAAKEAISKKLGMPLAKLTDEERRRIDEKLSETLDKTEIIEMVTSCFQKRPLLMVIEGGKSK